MGKFLETFDVAVIGGGPAGIMAAGRAAELGAKVILLEKNKTLAQKLLLTGNGRCNLTQNQLDNRKFVKKIGLNGKFLFSSLSRFGPKKTMQFFKSKNLLLKIEEDERVFPKSDCAKDVLKILQKYLETQKVKIFYEADIINFKLKNKQIKKIKLVLSKAKGLKNGIIQARNYIIATGGKSYPITGSTGDGYQWLKKMGHTIIDIAPALVPIKIKENWIKDLQGLSFKNIAINIFQNNKKKVTYFGEMIFTHFGLSGPIILNASKEIGEFLKKGKVEIKIDFKPTLNFQQLDEQLQNDFQRNANKNFENYLCKLFPKKMISIIIKLLEINANKKINAITKEERKNLINFLKETKISVLGLMGYDQAIITSGGINLKEVDSKTMRSKIIDNLFFAGEILDLDGPTGGYNLQICWSTGYTAGTYASIK
ncbi:aminoacetone oxidase family FAD-binding enzyme [Candidatus Kuenenbacteria bacterium HGW-Kuenenbacteria-1]|uniref:Aminoacetone oxidase family FAD-binding enzyme n=1 Tax=Candidatus Kuenenbacteria bacterium HGW-Kuenenbacteria-1 TaxID=2013812 RepID=A0A2N1UMV8_9BACT|nr:MAG: aminoacetone oxidase family FAD-binding enzyme [Candidatus Kuenenbacteria bacterium HGW-Kuenenbacteria-1]